MAKHFSYFLCYAADLDSAGAMRLAWVMTRLPRGRPEVD